MSADRQVLLDLANLVVTPAEGIRAVFPGDGALLVDEVGSRTIPLNQSGALLWNCLDGEASLGEICADLAEGFGLDPRQVAEGVEPLVRTLLDRRFVTAGGFAADAFAGVVAESCCPPGHFALAPGVEARIHQLVHDGVWLEESADSCRDARYLLGPQGEVVARVRSEHGPDRLVGIRTNDLAVAAEVRERLGDLLADDEPFGYPNLSLLMGDTRGPVRDVNIVVRRGVRAFHTFSREEAIRATLALVPTFGSPPAGLLPLQARPLVRDHRAVLVADVFAEPLDAERRRLERAGFAILPVLPVLVDTASAEAVIPEVAGSSGTARVAISDLVVTGAQVESEGSMSFDLARLTPLVSGGQRPLVAREVGELADLVQKVPPTWVPAVERRRLADVLLSL